MQLLMLHWRWHSLFLVQELPLRIQLPFRRVLIGMVSPFQKCITYIARFMTFWIKLSIQIGNGACILDFLLNFASRQCHESNLQLSFISNVNNTVPPSEAWSYTLEFSAGSATTFISPLTVFGCSM